MAPPRADGLGPAEAGGPAAPDSRAARGVTAAPGGTAAPDPVERAELAGRVALVTGGSGGIGRALSRRLAAAGAAVVLGYGQHAEAAADTAAQIVAAGGRAAAVGADLGDPAGPGNLVKAAEDALGLVDVLVSNAGLGGTKTLAEVTAADFDAMVAVNLRAPFLLAQRVLPGMAGRGFGRILFVSSVAAFTGGIVGPHYAASKAGLNGLTHFLASRYASSGVTVNGLAPALITETGMLPGDPEDLRHQIPAGRLGRPDEVADLALAILGNAYLTNQVISLDGGMYPR
jgi:3-oxoacyl-[acyl-carrier protein] reductase